VWQMLMNLLSNARKFTTAGYIRTTVSLDAAQTTLRVEVADTGIGVRKDQAHELFKPFGQLQGFAGGTGLGLYSVKAKASALGGTVGVAPNSPKGSIFWFDIPYVPGEPEPSLLGEDSPSLTPATKCLDLPIDFARAMCVGEATQAKGCASDVREQGQKRPPADTASETVLVIEDDVPTRMLMRRGLTKLGYQVEEASNGEEGLLKMQTRLYNMVLSDIMMPVMDGIECARRLRQWERETSRRRQHICALSANIDKTWLENNKYEDIDDFVAKPVNIKTLLHHLDGRFMTLPSSDEHQSYGFGHDDVSHEHQTRHRVFVTDSNHLGTEAVAGVSEGW